MTALHFSDLKRMAQSALHFKHARDNPSNTTPAKRIGSQTHAMVFDQPLRPVFNGRRAGQEWQLYASSLGVSAEEILNETENDTACEIANAVYSHSILAEARKGARFEVPMKWTMSGVECATRGIDIQWTTHHDDLKTCRTVEPSRLLWDCTSRLYHAQLAWYEIGRSIDHGFKRTKPHRLLCVENSPPYDVAVVELSDALIEEGKRACFKWFEQYKVSLESNQWPGYSLAPLTWEPRVRFDEEIDATDNEEEITE